MYSVCGECYQYIGTHSSSLRRHVHKGSAFHCTMPNKPTNTNMSCRYLCTGTKNAPTQLTRMIVAENWVALLLRFIFFITCASSWKNFQVCSNHVLRGWVNDVIVGSEWGRPEERARRNCIIVRRSWLDWYEPLWRKNSIETPHTFFSHTLCELPVVHFFGADAHKCMYCVRATQP